MGQAATGGVQVAPVGGVQAAVLGGAQAAVVGGVQAAAVGGDKVRTKDQIWLMISLRAFGGFSQLSCVGGI